MSEKKYRLEDSDSNKQIDSNNPNNENPFSNLNLHNSNNNNIKKENNNLFKRLSEENIRNNNKENTIIKNDNRQDVSNNNSLNCRVNPIHNNSNLNISHDKSMSSNNNFAISNLNNSNNASNNSSNYNILDSSINNSDIYFKNDESIIKTRLSDMGNKSYLNAILQNIGNIDYLKYFFLNDKVETGIVESLNFENLRLSFTFQRLFLHLKEGNQIYEPKFLLSILQEKNVIFKSKSHELNPKFCINYILDKLHEELNKKINENNFQQFNQYNDEEVINKGKSNYEMNNSSIISKLFNFYILKEIRCNQCATRKYLLQNFFTFELDLSGYYNLRKKNRNSIYDFLDYAVERKKIAQIFCEKCNKLCGADLLMYFINKPEIFVFILDRGDFDTNLMNINFIIDEKINIRNYFYYAEESIEYKLIGIVSIYNKYISFIKDENDNSWYLFYDCNAKKVDLNDIINKIKHIPCVLFYKLIK